MRTVTRARNQRAQSVRINVWVPPEIRNDLRAIASMSSMTAEAWVEGLITQALKAHAPALQALRNSVRAD